MASFPSPRALHLRGERVRVRGGRSLRTHPRAAQASIGQLADEFEQRIKNAIDVVEDVSIARAKDAKPQSFKLARALRIGRQLGIGAVRCAVGFDDQTALAAEKIGKVGANRCLAHELEPGEVPVSQLGPQLRLGRSFV